MTGIERLREWADGYAELGKDHTTIDVVPSGMATLFSDIADQIEREQGRRVSRMRVLSVVTEMERHVSGVEGMEDSPVARWARELRAALGGDVRDPAADVSVSVYDLLPEEDREAIAWVREHGGLDEVEAHWSGRVPLTSVKRMVALHKAKRERLKAHALGLERKCAERGETIRALSDKAAKQSDEIRVMRDVIAETCARLGVEGTGSTVDDAQVIWREISRRLMPEGMEWPVFEDGKPVRVGDEVVDEAEELVFRVSEIAFSDGYGTCLRYEDQRDGNSYNFIDGLEPGERVKRSAPKVLDADGVEIRVGDAVWPKYPSADRNAQVKRAEVVGIQAKYERVDVRTVYATGLSFLEQVDADRLTHRAPVLAADGKPLREGETVWNVKTGERYVVGAFAGGCINVSDGRGGGLQLLPSQLTHERPEIDSWGRWREEWQWPPVKYCELILGVEYDHDTQLNEAFDAQGDDLVRRARALAERGL